MRKLLFLVSYLTLHSVVVYSQSVPNSFNAAQASPSSEKASQLSGNPVNVFTGTPQVSVPLYSYHNEGNGLSADISLEYFTGGIRVAESPTVVGLGWYLNAGGVITRAVRGMPDDLNQNGYLFSPAIPTDFRSNADKYYYDSLDAQQDVFQFNFNGRSGKFYIGKNQQVVMVPLSKMRIIPILGTGSYGSQIIASFRVITEDGTKYDFKDAETSSVYTDGTDTSFYHAGYAGLHFNSSWYLSQIISSFSTDTIRFTYNTTALTSSFSFPQVTFVRNSDGVRTVTYSPKGSTVTTIKKLSSIVFPDKTKVLFIYGDKNYTPNDNALFKVTVVDTAFRLGYMLDYQTTANGGQFPTKLLLSTVTEYTAKEKKAPYQFFYNSPYFPLPGSAADTIQNKQDYWGFYNGATNGSNLIPKINNYTWGANRQPDNFYATSNALRYYYVPEGGFIEYEYEPNDQYPFLKDPRQLSITANSSSQNTIVLNQVSNNKHQMILTLNNSVPRTGIPPISGGGGLICNIKSSDGTILYKTITISLYDLFYVGMKTWTFNLPNGTYRLETQLSSGTSITGSFPLTISWINKLTDNSKSAMPSGGIRVKQVISYLPHPQDSITTAAETEEFKYLTEDGKSSGFLGEVPQYDYPFQQTVNYGTTTTTSYTVVSSEPVSNMDFAEGSGVGYSRVEVYKGSSSHNTGKTVYDFTDLHDVNGDVFTSVFPYTPSDTRGWGTGLPKKISVYDSTGRLVKRTVNTIAFDTMVYQDNNFKSIQTGNSATTVNGDPANPSTPKVRTYVADEYYPLSGRAYITASADTLFQTDGSKNTSSKNYTYDTNYNVIKIISVYDRNRGLLLEQRFYYPYNYTISGAIKTLRDSCIISPVIATENWLTGDGNPRILSTNFSSFRKITTGYIKPDTVYSLESGKPVPESLIGLFNPALLNRNTTYFKPQIFYLQYDSLGNLLQALNLKTNESNSIIMDYGLRYPVAKVSRAAYNQVAYTSFESDGNGNWTISSPLRDSTAALTGRKSYNLSNGMISKSGLSSSTPYLLTLWAKSGASVSVNSVAVPPAIASQNGWNLYSVTLSSISAATIAGSGLIDELRLYPKDAGMITATYDPMVGITSTTDANNTVVYNEYDNLNRLKLVRDKDKNIIKRYDYSDTTMKISIVPVWSNGTIGPCSGYGDGRYDSTYTDTNLFSQSYSSKKTVPLTDRAICCVGPVYKMVNGHCEPGQRINTSTTYMKINNPNGSDPPQIWVWSCTYHYQWSDGSISSDYTEYNSTACTLGGGAGEM